jgi:hypothetical protein
LTSRSAAGLGVLDTASNTNPLETWRCVVASIPERVSMSTNTLYEIGANIHYAQTQNENWVGRYSNSRYFRGEDANLLDIYPDVLKHRVKSMRKSHTSEMGQLLQLKKQLEKIEEH